ncbi:YbaY family lipoprotein [Sphingopyxis bauzanensis]|uniref:YbaY family lipoprotein n=1 Tax=Sphingopyxis bauzanensis TaxID=651663 RepID=UPI00227D4610|nr:YbaY family lipoprotein [Sphingopyxis bauzanensis]
MARWAPAERRPLIAQQPLATARRERVAVFAQPGRIQVDAVPEWPRPQIADRPSFTADGRQVPFAFSLTVDQRPLDPRHSYAVSARITDASGRLMFITDTRNSVAFDDRSRIDMGTLTLVKTR